MLYLKKRKIVSLFLPLMKLPFDILFRFSIKKEQSLILFSSSNLSFCTENLINMHEVGVLSLSSNISKSIKKKNKSYFILTRLFTCENVLSRSLICALLNVDMPTAG